MMSNLSLADRMKKSLLDAGNQQRQILTQLRPYLPLLAEDLVMVIRYARNPSRILRYPYMHRQALKTTPWRVPWNIISVDGFLTLTYFFDRIPINSRSGAFARKTYPYDRLALFDFADNYFDPKPVIKVADLPIAAKITEQIVQCLAKTH